MAVFAFALALETGRPLDLRGRLRPALAGPATLEERRGDGWHAAWSNPPAGPQTDFAIGGDGTVAIVTSRLERRHDLRGRLGLAHDAGDAVLLLRAHAEWGEAMLDHLRGDFAFVLWDAAQRRLIAARDQIGCSPLFHREQDRVLLAGTAFGAIRDYDRARLTLSEIFIGDILLNGLPTRHEISIYNEIHRMPPAHALHVADGRVDIRRYWSFPDHGDPLMLRSRRDYGEHFYTVLREAVAERLPDTGPVSLLMSGGLDSTAIAAAVADILGTAGAERVMTYTTIFRDDPEQEGPFAALAARHLGLRNLQVEASDYLTRPLPERPDWAPPEPGMIAPLIPEAVASEAAAAGGGALLNGMGPDVYLRPPGTNFWHLAAGGHRALPGAVRHLKAFGRFPALGVRTALGRVRRYLLAQPIDRPLPEWIDPDFAARSALRERIAARRAIDGRLRASMLTAPYWSMIASIGHPGLTGRAAQPASPFLSLALVELAVRLPLPAVHHKAILRWAMRGRLPDAVVDRPKAVLGPAVINLSERDPGIIARRRALIARYRDALAPYVDPDAAIASLEDTGPAGRALLGVEALAFWFHAHAGDRN